MTLSLSASNMAGFRDSDGFVNFEFHSEHGAAQGFPLSIVLQGFCPSSIECLVEEEIQRPEVWELEPFHIPKNNAFEMLPDPFDGKILRQKPIVFFFAGNNTDVAGISFVAGSGVRDINEADPHMNITGFPR